MSKYQDVKAALVGLEINWIKIFDGLAGLIAWSIALYYLFTKDYPAALCWIAFVIANKMK